MKKQEFKRTKNEERLRNLWDNFKCSNIQIIGWREGKEEVQATEISLEKIMKENFPNLVKEIDIQIQEAQTIPKKLDPKRNMPQHNIIKLPNIKEKERILKAARETDTATYRGVPIRLSADFSKETLQAKMHWKEVFKVMKRTYIQSYEKYSKL